MFLHRENAVFVLFCTICPQNFPQGLQAKNSRDDGLKNSPREKQKNAMFKRLSRWAVLERN